MEQTNRNAQVKGPILRLATGLQGEKEKKVDNDRSAQLGFAVVLRHQGAKITRRGHRQYLVFFTNVISSFSACL